MNDPRLLSGPDAAAYLGLTPTSFSKWVAQGKLPKPLPGTRRWDRKAIDLALDQASGIVAPAAMSEEDPYEMWKREHYQEAEWERKYDARQSAKVKR